MDAEGLEKTREAGRIAARCREWARGAVRPGVALRQVLETIEDMIRQAGGAPAFPAQTSRNEIAAHYCSSPEDGTVYEEGDVVKVDLGVHVDGWIADTACTIDLSSDGRWQGLVQASADALAAAIATVGDGVPVGQVGAAVERTITRAGFEPIRNLTGHGLDRWKVSSAKRARRKCSCSCARRAT
jgi:methionyl aminopeptidase